jgi:branched-chain amino acid transport system substrate-binding protein/urea transport system substrate-binding protein
MTILDAPGRADAIASPAGRVMIGKDHHAAMSLFIAKTQGGDLVTVRALGEITPEPECR